MSDDNEEMEFIAGGAPAPAKEKESGTAADGNPEDTPIAPAVSGSGKARQPAPGKRPARKPAGKAAPAKRPKVRKPRLQRFDEVLMQLVKEGRSDAGQLRATFNVDEAEFAERVSALARRGLVSVGEGQTPIRLSIAGVNAYKPAWKRLADKWLARETKEENAVGSPQDQHQEKAGSLQPFAAQAVGKTALDIARQEVAESNRMEKEARVSSEHRAVQEKLAALPEGDEERLERLDLMDVIKKYGPNREQQKEKRKASPFLEGQERAQQARQAAGAEGGEPLGGLPTRKAARAGREPIRSGAQDGPEGQEKHYTRIEPAKQAPLQEDGKCELCKTGFSVSVKAEENNPKYGHCFCGAAYHKDCFEAVLEGDKKCLRCGRKLALALDSKAEEAISEIKDVFNE